MDNFPLPEWDRLLSAAAKNDVRLIRQLVEKEGVDPSHANGVRQSALHIASLWGHVEAVEVLVGLGANTQATNSLTGATPLHMVAQSRKKEASITDRMKIVDILVANGASLETPDKYGGIPLSSLQPSTDPNFKSLADKLQPQAPTLFNSLTAGDTGAIKALIAEKGPNALQIDFQGETPVECVVKILLGAGCEKDKVCLDMLELLVAHGASMSGCIQQDPSSMETIDAPLLKLVSAVREEMQKGTSERLPALVKAVEIFMGSGVTVDSETVLLLHQAARRGEVKFAEFMINCVKVDPNAKGRQGLTPLHFAARSGQVEVLELLLKQPGIDANVDDDRGKKPLDAAVVNEREEAAKILDKFLA